MFHGCFYLCKLVVKKLPSNIAEADTPGRMSHSACSFPLGFFSVSPPGLQLFCGLALLLPVGEVPQQWATAIFRHAFASALTFCRLFYIHVSRKSDYLVISGR